MTILSGFVFILAGGITGKMSVACFDSLPPEVLTISTSTGLVSMAIFLVFDFVSVATSVGKASTLPLVSNGCISVPVGCISSCRSIGSCSLVVGPVGFDGGLSTFLNIGGSFGSKLGILSLSINPFCDLNCTVPKLISFAAIPSVSKKNSSLLDFGYKIKST